MILLVLAAVCLFTVRDKATGQSGVAVDLELVLAIDCSYSVDAQEFALQVRGLARAFQHPDVLEAIAAGPTGRIAVSVVQWSESTSQAVVIPWAELSSAGDLQSFASRLFEVRRSVPEGGTSITMVMRYAANMLKTNQYQGRRLVIDIAADGRNNNGGNPRPMRELLAEQGITVNGLAILNEDQNLDKYFERNVVAGPGRFVIVANDYEAYGKAILRKLIREITGPVVS